MAFKRKALLCLLALGLALPASAAVYKWKDAQGNIQYSDTPPPPQSKAQELKVKNSGGVNPLEYAPKADPKAAGQNAESEKQKQANREANADNCKKARAQLSYLEKTSGPMNKINEEGRSVRMSGEEREGQLKQLRDQISQFCS
ncbi:DUF4124 domain-containing protein [Chitinimonas lacunae]|uniref:DUF4124 domain-containing protein n=1 Tax=Chitinimonas lacunae TaxID=1963018 RepID=A0ABV8MKR6_9NEIS